MAKKVIGYLNLFSDVDLGPLTETRALGSTSFLGRYALMDFALSNFTNSKIDNINILVKENFRSVARHVGGLKPWVNNTKLGHQNILINEEGIRNPDRNTDLNCIARNEWAFDETESELVVVAPAHIISVIDLSSVIKAHDQNGTDITVVYAKIPNGNVAFSKSNVLSLSESEIITDAKKNTSKVKDISVSLETYVLSSDVFRRILNDKNLMNIGSLKKVIEKLIKDKDFKIKGYEYKGYVRCMDNFEHFVEYSMELFEKENAFSLFHSKEMPIYTRSRNTPPALYGVNAEVKNSFIANGAHIDGTVINSVISRYVVIEKGACIKNSIIFGNSIIKSGAIVENAVVDRKAVIENNAVVKGDKNKFKYLEQGKIVK